MDKFIVNGGKKLKGEVNVSGAKNAALKMLVAACLTDEPVTIENVPLISDFYVMIDILNELGAEVTIKDHNVKIQLKEFKTTKISLERAAYIRTSSLFLAPLLARTGNAAIPNPGGCKIGARPIDRVVEGLKCMGMKIEQDDSDFFYASASDLHASNNVTYHFAKNSHTGTETLMMVSVLGKRKTILENAAQEPEVDELIELLNNMGAKVKRTAQRTIEIQAVEKLHGTTFKASYDRNEIVSFAVAGIITEGDILVKDITSKGLEEFLSALDKVGGGYQQCENGMRFFSKGKLKATDVTTTPHPGFMTDWQGPWAILMTKAEGTSILHETVYENRFGYAEELKKMGANINYFNPVVENPDEVYNFNIKDDKKEFMHAEKITGPVDLHGQTVKITDLRAGATLVIAAIAATGQSTVYGIEHLDRGYERFEERLKRLGADVQREKE